jgi:hypothetical protein
MELVFVFTACVNGVAAVLAWAAKLRWSKQYQDATNRIIESKDAEIAVLQRHLDTLQRLNPKEISEWYEGAIKISAAYSETLHKQLADADETINKLRASGSRKDEDLRRAREDYQRLSASVAQIDLAVSQRQLPDMITVVNSGTYSKALDKSTAEFDLEDL